MTTSHGTAAGKDAGRELTVTQIAEMAGVSPATVSKVLNGRPDVGPRTRAVVEDIISRYGYRRRKKITSPTTPLEVVFHELAGPYPTAVLSGVHRVAREHRLAVVLSELQGGHTPAGGWFEDVLMRRPTGVIAVFSDLTETQSRQLRARGIPLVLVDPTGKTARHAPSVGASNRAGGLAATRHLLELGHRRIAIITGPEYALSSRTRLEGYRAALRSAGVPVAPELIRVGDFQVEDGVNHTRELLRLPDPPTAVFACNDGEALGVYQAAAEAGLRVPDDLSVVGFDDFFPSGWTVPPLTTVRQPLTEMAAAATAMVVSLASGKALARSRVELATELIVRGSTAPPAR
ncbi:LacI family DNA-binding transcriptional regulator [Streptomyces litchfieldiae]|uniref:LacI family DNA-binding transcriptional regulator n=1 Tax=Streptomyces litchfieldiae TaxID=3075543 RepID=A0ABU2N3Q2_9ACTN|nr:LacI family DNA-binding transcriptional regulator [Streptomyces sp. DSM 44938]MDT0347693.1 LacI family DNA-binding transcriptional regulator [Streptomyces sp. DSM 44938]